MKIAIVTTNNSNMYSGGRYHSLGIAVSLASIGENEVYYVTNNKPIFYDDFKASNKNVRFFLTQNFRNDMPKGKFDIVILIPHQDDDPFYPKVKLFTLKRHAKLVFVNFESGNWFNELSSRSLVIWEPWKKACEIGCLMLSISQEGNQYAKDFYIDYLKLTEFDYWYPCINVLEADRSTNIVRENKRVLILVRIANKHKGCDDLNSLFCPELKDTTFVLLIGSERVLKAFTSNIEKLASKNQIHIEYKYQLSDYEKFIEYKKASVLVFPSYFEGYGYPPVEALYCNTPCIAYDLPVLREVTNNGAIFVPRGDAVALKNALIIFFQKPQEYQITGLRKLVYDQVNFDHKSSLINNILKKYMGRNSHIDLRNQKGMIEKLEKEIKRKCFINYKNKIKNKLNGFITRSSDFE